MSERYKTPSWFRTRRHPDAEDKVRAAIDLIVEARRVLTLYEFEEFIRDNIASRGNHGFIGSIGEAMVRAATIEAAPSLPHPIEDKT